MSSFANIEIHTDLVILYFLGLFYFIVCSDITLARLLLMLREPYGTIGRYVVM